MTAAVLGVVVAAGGAALLREPDAGGVTERRALTGEERIRHQLYEELQPVRLANCELERFGESNDGGYLMCGNLLDEVEAGYSYGISGYDQWGCDISTRFGVRVHQYDCFDTRATSCPAGDLAFHAECVAGSTFVDEDGRRFDTMARQFMRNGDSIRRLVIKMDVEGAEWDSLEALPSDMLARIDQLAIELHYVHEERFITTVRRLKEHFHVVNIHYNNHACEPAAAPFPAWAYEVLFVSKRIGRLDPTGAAEVPHPLDERNDPHAPDCQTLDELRARTQ